MTNIIRKLHEDDLPGVLSIETAEHIAPWTYETFTTCMRAGYPGWVLVSPTKEILGFIVVSHVLDECHVLNLCVRRSHQHQGLGTLLLEHALNEAKRQGVGIAYLEVRRSNAKAIALYQKMHFKQVGLRKRYYATADGQEDALVFARSLIIIPG